MTIEIPDAPRTGFAESDLTRATIDPAIFSGGEFVLRVAPERVSAICPEGPGLLAVDILIGSGDIGTERRYRSGETTIEHLQQICRQRNPSCRLKAIESGEAVFLHPRWAGRVRPSRMGGGMCSTAILVRDGRMLTVRSVARGAALAEGERRRGRRGRSGRRWSASVPARALNLQRTREGFHGPRRSSTWTSRVPRALRGGWAALAAVLAARGWGGDVCATPDH